MKRIITIVLVLLMLLTVACSVSDSPASEGRDMWDDIAEGRVPSYAETRKTDTPAPESTAASTPKATPKPTASTPKSTPVRETTSIEWKTVVFNYTDPEGYTFECTLKLSPWILLSNTDLIEAAWSKVSKGKELPSYDSWNIKPGFNGFPTLYANAYNTNWNAESLCSDGLNDMYYSVGSLTIRNKTDGWSITEQNARDFRIPMYCGSDDTTLRTGRDHFGFVGSRLFYSDQSNTFVRGALFHVYMTNNTWGPLTFVLVTGEVFSPNFPDGGYYDFVRNHIVLRDNELAYTKQLIPETRLGIIGKDRKYVPPVSD